MVMACLKFLIVRFQDLGGGSGNVCFHVRGRIQKKRHGRIHPQIGSARCEAAQWCGLRTMPPLSWRARFASNKLCMMILTKRRREVAATEYQAKHISQRVYRTKLEHYFTKQKCTTEKLVQQQMNKK